MIDFVGKKRWFFMLSGAIILIGIIFAVTAGLPWGIDFTGGTLMTLEYDDAHPVDQATVENTLSDLGYTDVTVQESRGEKQFFVRMDELDAEEEASVRQAVAEAGLSVEGFDKIADPIAREKARGAIIAIVVASVGILLYISWAFRKLPKPFRYGTCAVIALIHDVLVVMAFYAIFSDTLNLEINLMFITGLLTVIGYSVNDTIVVFDRIRENLSKGSRKPFAMLVNNSLMETLIRSTMTSMTTLIVMVSVYLFVGEAIESFMLVLIVGIISGTYSSIFIASQVLVVWETGRFGGKEKLVPVKSAE